MKNKHEKHIKTEKSISTIISSFYNREGDSLLAESRKIVRNIYPEICLNSKNMTYLETIFTIEIYFFIVICMICELTNFFKTINDVNNYFENSIDNLLSYLAKNNTYIKFPDDNTNKRFHSYFYCKENISKLRSDRATKYSDIIMDFGRIQKINDPIERIKNSEEMFLYLAFSLFKYCDEDLTYINNENMFETTDQKVYLVKIIASNIQIILNIVYQHTNKIEKQILR